MQGILHSIFWVLLAKVLLAIFMFVTALLFLLILRRSGEWHQMLIAVEAECDFARDNAMLQATMARSQLAELQERLRKKPEKAEFEVVTGILKKAGPVLSLLMARETNLLKWGFAGANLAKSVFEYFSRKQNN